jgi:sodium/proline symporter
MVSDMSRGPVILITIVVYNLVLIAIGLWARRRTRNHVDFFLGGRRMGGSVAALSAAASSSSAWTLLGVSGAAYVWGLGALWLFPATLGGFLLNWIWVAPRLRRLSKDSGAITLTDVIAGDRTDPLFSLIMRLGAVIVLFSFSFYVAAQFQAAGHAFASAFDISWRLSVLIGVLVVLAYTLLGGFWAVSVTDTVQALLMLASSLLLPVIAVLSVGGLGQLFVSLDTILSADQQSLTRGLGGALGIAFVAGTLGIGLGYPGQPHVVNRFMALENETALRRGRLIAIGWAMIVYGGMIVLGWSARVMYPGVGDPEQVFFEAAQQLLSPVMAGIMIAAVLSAIMSTADSQLLVASSAVTHDWRLGRESMGKLGLARVILLIVSLVAALLALFAPEAIFSRVLFAWHALGSAFGPVLMVRLAGRDVSSRATLAAVIMGFGLTVMFHFFPDAPGDAAERLLPFFVALGLALIGSTRRRAG